MLELTIDEKVYPFNFGMGFMREINKRMSRPVDGMVDTKKNIGLQYKIAELIDGDVETLVEVLEAANKGMAPRVTREMLDNYIDSEDVEIDELFKTVMDFLSKTNATKKTTAAILKAVEEEKAKRAAQTAN